jgi:hypothetical protein
MQNYVLQKNGPSELRVHFRQAKPHNFNKTAAGVS